MLQQQAEAHQRVRQVTDRGAGVHGLRVAAGHAATLGVRQRHEARHAAVAGEGGVELVGDQAGDLAGAQAGGQQQPDLVGGDTVGSAHGLEGPCRGYRRAGDRQRRAVGQRGLLQVFEICGVDLPPVAPQRHLRVPCPLALGAGAGGRCHGEVEHLLAQLIHRRAVLVGPGVHVHVSLQHVEALAGGDHLEGRHEGEVGDGAVAGDEEDHVGARRHLPGDALQIVAGAVHEVVARLQHALAVVDDVIQAHLGVALHGGAEGFEDDVVQAAEHVAAGRVALGGVAVPGHALLELGDGGQEFPCRCEVAHVLQHVCLGADQFVGFRQTGGTAVANDRARHPGGQRVARYSRKGVRAAALQGHVDMGQGLLAARDGVHLRQPAADKFLAAHQVVLKPPRQAEKVVRHVGQRVVMGRHVVAQPGVGDGFGAVVHRQHGADVGVHHEAAQRPQHEIEVVGFLAAAALGVRHGNDAIDVGKIACHAAEAVFQGAGVAGGARRGAEDDDVIPGADAPCAAARVAHKGAGFGVTCHLLAGLEAGLVQQVRGDLVGEIGLARQLEIDVAATQGVENSGVADVRSGRDVAAGVTERQAPRQQRGAAVDGLPRKAMAFQQGVVQAEPFIAADHLGARLQPPRGDGDVVAGGGQSRHVVKVVHGCHGVHPQFRSESRGMTSRASRVIDRCQRSCGCHSWAMASRTPKPPTS